MISNPAEVLHQPIEFLETWPSSPFCRLSYEPELFKNCERILEFCTRERIAPCWARHRKDVRQVREVVRASLWLDVSGQLAGE